MSSPSILLLLLLFASTVSAGPLELPDGEAAVAAVAATPPSTSAPPSEERAIPAATLAAPSDGQHCTVDGAVFHNGERLPASADPDPCRACYCQGGEGVCTRVHCYRRPDCAPRHVPGSCCPKYDNCPPVPEERSPEPRVKDASTQTESLPPTTSTTESTTTEATVTTAYATETTATATTTLTDSTTTTATASEESTTTDDDEEEEEAVEAATSGYPPGIDLHALHEHLPFLSPGDANGPNT